MSGVISKVAEAVIPSATEMYYTAVGALTATAAAVGALVCGTQGELGGASALGFAAITIGSLVIGDVIAQRLSR